MKPQDVERVFGHERLRMATGEHVEVFREAASPGERRRYTKRFLETGDADFRQWTDREWRILARLIGHGARCVPDVVQFENRHGGVRQVQTYDAGITIDQWATLLPVTRDGVVRRNAFEDCAHWWALARHCIAALDEVHALGLVHLDVKADNICVPYGPDDFDATAIDARLHVTFERLALIDFAFSVATGEPLTTALPIGWQKDYDYQSPRLLRALEAGSAGDLTVTRALDWRCDLYSLAAMLRRYLPDDAWARGAGAAFGWTSQRYDDARALVYRLREAHDRDLPMPGRRPHRALLDTAGLHLEAADLQRSLQAGWTLARDVELADPLRLATPLTRIAPARPVMEARGQATAPKTVIEAWSDALAPPMAVAADPAVFRTTRIRVIATPAVDSRRVAREGARPARRAARGALVVCGIGALAALAAPYIAGEGHPWPDVARVLQALRGGPGPVTIARTDEPSAAREPAVSSRGPAPGASTEPTNVTGRPAANTGEGAAAGIAARPAGELAAIASDAGRAFGGVSPLAASVHAGPEGSRGTSGGEVPSATVGAEPAATGAKATDGQATDARATDGQTLTDATTTEGATAERPERATTEQASTERGTTERATTERATTERATTERASTERATTERATTERATTERATTERATTERATTAPRAATATAVLPRTEGAPVTEASLAQKPLAPSHRAVSRVKAGASVAPPGRARLAKAAPVPTSPAAHGGRVASAAGTRASRAMVAQNAPAKAASFGPYVARAPGTGMRGNAPSMVAAAPATTALAPAVAGPDGAAPATSSGSAGMAAPAPAMASAAAARPVATTAAAATPPEPVSVGTSHAPVAAPENATIAAASAAVQTPPPAPPRSLARLEAREPWQLALRDVMKAFGIREQRAAPVEERSVARPPEPVRSLRPPERLSERAAQPALQRAPVVPSPVNPPAYADARPSDQARIVPAPMPPPEAPVDTPSTTRSIPAPTNVAASAVAIDAGDDLRAQGARMLREVLPRTAAEARADMTDVLGIAANAETTGQNRAVYDAAVTHMHTESAYVPVSAGSSRARQLHADARQAFAWGRDAAATDLAMRAFAASPRDADIAGFLAFLELRTNPETARQLALHALAFSGPARVQREEDWTTLAVASALTGRQADATHAFMVELALTRNVDRTCRAALGAYNTYGERLRAPVQALLYRVRVQGRDYTAPSCTWPGYRTASG